MMKTAEQIRKEFLEFFKARGHSVVPSSPLVPDDPTLLFTNSGMVQFKDVFMGTGTRPYKRAVDTQKCLRVSGKHNDLDEVGHDTYHLTFFEMLGNWSFGDYFKKEAISWAWELLVEQWGVSPDRLYATVHEGDKTLSLEADHEAAELWKRETSIPHDHILFCSTKDNFWMMGDNGPCGPCSEIHVDLRPEHERQQRPGLTLVNQGHPQVIEVWNLVFIQYNARSDGTLEPLAANHVDTGMGLERIVAALQGKTSVYDTDLFTPIMERVRQLSGHTPQQMADNLVPYRVLADHGRALAFLIADGVVPGNEKQKYVLRMVMRRALRFGKKLGIDKPFLAEVAQAVLDTMGNAFAELIENRDTILKWAQQEEKLFNKTLDRGLDYFEKHVRALQQANNSVISGQEAFYLHDTLGFPIEVTCDLAREIGFFVDQDAFAQAMEQQRQRSKGQGASQSSDSAALGEFEKLDATVFTGYEAFSQVAKVLMVRRLDSNRYQMAFDKTPFYAAGGGQVWDRGWLKAVNSTPIGQVLQVEKDKRNVFIHQVCIDGQPPAEGQVVLLEVDAQRRKATQRNHTATHILHAALHRVVGAHAKQAGSLVAPDELRFDFSHFEALTPEQITQIEALANRVILDNLPVVVTQETLESAKAQGAMALFAEDYQGKETVRMVSILEPDNTAFSRELCGGTHVRCTGEIGGFKVVSEESVSAGVRRVKVATGTHVLEWLQQLEQTLEQVADLLHSTPNDVLQRLEALLQTHEALQKELAQVRAHQVASRADELASGAQAIGEATVIVSQSDLCGDELKQLADALEGRLNSAVVLLGGVNKERVQLVCKVSKGLTQKVKAGQIIKALTPIVGGGGGGAPHFAQGGGNRPDKLAQALDDGRQLIQDALA